MALIGFYLISVLFLAQFGSLTCKEVLCTIEKLDHCRTEFNTDTKESAMEKLNCFKKLRKPCRGNKEMMRKIIDEIFDINVDEACPGLPDGVELIQEIVKCFSPGFFHFVQSSLELKILETVEKKCPKYNKQAGSIKTCLDKLNRQCQGSDENIRKLKDWMGRWERTRDGCINY